MNVLVLKQEELEVEIEGKDEITDKKMEEFKKVNFEIEELTEEILKLEPQKRGSQRKVDSSKWKRSISAIVTNNGITVRWDKFYVKNKYIKYYKVYMLKNGRWELFKYITNGNEVSYAISNENVAIKLAIFK